MIHFEAVPDPTPAGGGEQTPEPEVEYAQIPAEEYQQMQEQIAALQPLAEMYQQYEQAPQEPQQGPQIPSDSFLTPADLEVIGQIVQQQMAPVSEFTMQAQLNESEDRARDIIGSVAQQAEYDLPEGGADWIRARAEDYVPEAQQRYGQGVQAAEAAIESAFNEYREMLDGYAKSYHDKQLNQLSTLSGAPREPSAAGAPAAQGLTPARNERELLQRWNSS